MSSSDDFFTDMMNAGSSSTSSPPLRSRQPPPPPPPPAAKATSGPSIRPAGSSRPSSTRPASSRSSSSRTTSSRSATSSRPVRPSADNRTQSSTSTSSSSIRPRPPTGSAARPPPAAFYGGASSSSGPAAAVSSAPAPTPSYYGSSSGPNTASNPSMSSDWYTPSAVGTGSATSAPYENSSMSMDSVQNLAGSAQTTQTPTVMNPYATPQPAFSAGPMDGMMDTGSATSNTQPQRGSFFSSSSSSVPTNDFEDEPPLLEELGINVEHILLKTKAVVLPFSRFGKIMDPELVTQDADLAGPVAFCLLLGGELLLSGKISFGYIYGFALFGCLAMTLVLNLVNQNSSISIWTVASILGYALLPVNVLALLKIPLVNLGKLETLGRILALLTVAWSTTASTRLLEQGCGMRDQRYLVAYPIALLYSAFVLITIF